MADSSALVWFRRDLRLEDHAALSHALQRHGRVHALFIFDRTILDPLPSRADRRVAFLHATILELDRVMGESAGAGMLVRHGDPREEVPRLAAALGVREVVCARDYEPAALSRDAAVARALEGQGIAFTALRDQVIFDEDEIRTAAGGMFSVFTPYRNAWLRALGPHRLAALDPAGPGRLAPKSPGESVPSLGDLGFEAVDPGLEPGSAGARRLWEDFRTRMDHYKALRDFPARKGVSYLSTHLRFGTLSIRELVRAALERGTDGARAWLDELIWREFYQQLLWHRPEVESRSFKPAFDRVAWEEGPEAEARFQAWCGGTTGYPLVDAAQRQLVQTGWMHNRLRMVSASFLTKDLGIHWLRGERFFARHLLDFDLAANCGGWQWAASTGCDAQPWFRIFNPVTQSRKFDPEGAFIRRYCPELAGLSDKAIHAPWEAGGVPGYPGPMVDHALARQLALARFKAIG